MNFELKSLSPAAIPKALERARTYRLLNEPVQAESICRDILRVDPKHQEALVLLILSITDQFKKGLADRFPRAQELVSRLNDEYERFYYSGIICERRARFHLRSRALDASHTCYEWLRRAMSWYERAEVIRPSGNDESLLRWNACVRTTKDESLEPAPADTFQPFLE